MIDCEKQVKRCVESDNSGQTVDQNRRKKKSYWVGTKTN